MTNPETPQLDFGGGETTDQPETLGSESRPTQAPLAGDQPKRTKIVRDPSDGSTYEVTLK